MDRKSWPLPRPIEKAPVKQGEIYGPCLVSPGANGREWDVAEFHRTGWFTLSGSRELHPTHYMPLPSRAVLLS